MRENQAKGLARQIKLVFIIDRHRPADLLSGS